VAAATPVFFGGLVGGTPGPKIFTRIKNLYQNKDM